MKAKSILISFLIFWQLAVNAQESCDTLNYKARFDYAMSLFEQDSLVAACENFYKVIYMLEEDDSVRSKKSRGKLVEILNAHAMVGRIYIEFDLPNIALSHFNMALGYAKDLNSNDVLSHIYKRLGIAHHAYNADSAIYYYQKCIDTYPNHLNKIDVDKAIAEILFYEKNERDSALNLMRSNLGIIEHENVLHAYYSLMGEMMLDCKQYDSAIYYLSMSIDSELYFLQLNSANNLSRVYDSLGDYEKKSYYDGIVARLGMERIDGNFEVDRVRAMNDIYNEHKQADREAIARKRIVLILLLSLALIVAAAIFFRYRHLKKNRLLLKRIDEMTDDINTKDDVIRNISYKHSLITGKIKNKNAELQKQTEIIKKQNEEILLMKEKLDKEQAAVRMDAFLGSEICFRIMNDKDLQMNQNDFDLLLQSANLNLRGFVVNISKEYPRLKKEDLCYICLMLIDLNDKQISSLFGVTYSAIKTRRSKICNIIEVKNELLYKYLIDRLYLKD